MSESSTSMSCRRRYEASPTSRNSSISISSRSTRAAARIAFDEGAEDLRIVFSDRCTFSGREPRSARSGFPSIRDFPYGGFAPSWEAYAC
jgi:hypothetical protein